MKFLNHEITNNRTELPRIKFTKIFSSFLIIYSCSVMQSTNNCNLRELKERISKLDLQIGMATCSDCELRANLGYRVMFVPLRPSENFESIHSLDTLSTTCWIYLLEDRNSAWKTNLLLYYLHDRDALYLVARTEEEWLSSDLRRDDIEYWKKYFNK